MANRNIRFDTGFENWLDTTLDKIRRETSSKQPKSGGLGETGSQKKYSTFEDSANNNTEGQTHELQTPNFGPNVLADDLSLFEYELIDEEWEELASGGMSGKQREQVRQEGFQAGGQFYTTVWGLEDDDDGERRKEDEYPQTPSARERVAKILKETELGENSQQRPRREFKFDSINYKSVKNSQSAEDVDSWSLEDEPAVTLDPSRLPYIHREAGDGKEQQPVRREPIYKGANDGDVDANRNSQLSASLPDEFMDAHETLDDMTEGIDIKTPQGKGRALLPMEDLELSFEDESDENILDVEDEYGGSVSIRPISDTQPIIMDGSELQQLALKRRKKVRRCIFITLGVLAVGGFSLVTYLTVHFLSK